MFRPLPSTLRRAARRLLLGCLLLALPVYGLSGRLVELLGQQHFHAQFEAEPVGATVAMAGWQDFRRIVAGSGEGGHGHHHRHSAPERHHHAHDDASVVALDAGAAAEGAAGEASSFTPAGSAALVLALAGLLALPLATPAGRGWLAQAPPRMRRRDGERLERPPRQR